MKKVFLISYFVTLGISIILVIVGFILPPVGDINPNVLKAVGELMCFALIGGLPYTIQTAKSVHINTPSGSSIHIDTDTDTDNNES